MNETLGDLGEFEVIRRLMGVVPAATGSAPGVMPGTSGDVLGPSARAHLEIGAGDDAAIIRPRAGFELAVTTDTFVEGTHFRRDWIDAEGLGARLAEANLSDLAAMAAEPRWALVSFGVRSDHATGDLVAIQRGIAKALGRHGAVIAGGNLSAVRGEEWMTLTLLGEVRTGTAWTRAGARPGQWVAVTGGPGRAGAGVALAAREASRVDDPRWAELITAWRAPRARVELASALAPTGSVTAAIDLSDGLSSDLARLCAASGVGARLVGEAWPADPALEAAAHELGVTIESLRFGASDDYELVLAVDPERHQECLRVASELQVPLAFIGVLTEVPGVFLESSSGAIEPIPAGGYDHFRFTGP